jgi:hypothetical protein
MRRFQVLVRVAGRDVRRRTTCQDGSTHGRTVRLAIRIGPGGTLDMSFAGTKLSCAPAGLGDGLLRLDQHGSKIGRPKLRCVQADDAGHQPACFRR